MYGCKAIIIPLQREITIIITQNNQSKCSINSYNTSDESSEADTNKVQKAMEIILNEIKADKEKIRNYTIHITSDLPMNSGLGSSAGFCVAMTKALAEYYGKALTEQQTYNIACKAEEIFHGKTSGTDIIATLMQKPIIFKKDTTQNNCQELAINNQYTFVLVNTGKKESTEKMVEIVKQFKEKNKTRFDELCEKYNQIVENAEKLLTENPDNNTNDERLKRFGALMIENHKLLKELGLSNERIEQIITQALQQNAYGAKLSGGGGGGHIVVLTDKKKVHHITQHFEAGGIDAFEITITNNQLKEVVQGGYLKEAYPKEFKQYKKQTSTATAKAYPIQGILKYHGLADWQLRTAFFSSISMTNSCAYTRTTVTFSQQYTQDTITISNKEATESEKKRVLAIIDFLRKLANTTQKVRIDSENYFADGTSINKHKEYGYNTQLPKGLGTSAAAGAALALAATHALFDKEISANTSFVSAAARLLAGSACRSVAGGIALWQSYPDIKHEDCFAIRLDKENQFSNYVLITIPSISKENIKTDIAHLHAQNSPFFTTWLQQRQEKIAKAVEAIKHNDFWTIAKLAEEDTLNLHNITMTTNNPIVLYKNETLNIMELCYKLRDKGTKVYYSIDTGPTIVLMTDEKNKNVVIQALHEIQIKNYFVGRIAGGAELL